MVGFTDQVRDAVVTELPEVIGHRVAVVSSKPGTPNLRALKDHLFAAADKGMEILVVFAYRREDQWVQDGIAKMTAAATRRYPDARIKTTSTQDFRSTPFVVQQATEFLAAGEDAGAIGPADMENVTGGRRILCVRSASQSAFGAVFVREGFSGQAIDGYVHEEEFPADRNSNLSAKLSRRASNYAFLLYAYEGLRHLSKGAKKTWGERLVNRSTTRSVVTAFKTRILRMR